MFKTNRHKYLEQAGAGGDPGATTVAGAGGGDTVAGAAGGDTVAGAAGGDNILALGKDGVVTPLNERIPEKYRVMKADGTFDLEASFAKVEDARSNLEKRLGAGDAPPKEASEYKLTVPEALKDKIDPEKLATDEQFIAMRDRWHKAGFTQAQFDVATADFFETAAAIGEQLAGDAAPMTFEAAQAELRKTWKTDAELKAGARDAYRAAASVLGEEGTANLMAKHGNDPQIVMLLAAFGKEMQEDRSAGSGGGGQGGGESIETLMLSEAYQNPRHPDHAAVSHKVRASFEKKYGTAAAM